MASIIFQKSMVNTNAKEKRTFGKDGCDKVETQCCQA